jgi:hypothetical protein
MLSVQRFAQVLVLFAASTIAIAKFRASAPKTYSLSDPIQLVRPYLEAQAAEPLTRLDPRLRRPVL